MAMIPAKELTVGMNVFNEGVVTHIHTSMFNGTVIIELTFDGERYKNCTNENTKFAVNIANTVRIA